MLPWGLLGVIFFAFLAHYYVGNELDLSSYLAANLSKLFIRGVFPRDRSSSEVQKSRSMVQKASSQTNVGRTSRPGRHHQQSLSKMVHSIYNLNISSHLDARVNIALRLYLPHQSGAVYSSSLRPIVLWFHDGGFVLGSTEADDTVCARLCNQTGHIIVSTSYRLAPEHPFPAAVEDVSSVLRWLQTSGGAQLRDMYGGDPHRILLAGEGAGGNLAAAVTAVNADESLTSDAALWRSVRGLLLVYPMLEIDVVRDSHLRYSRANGLLTREQLQWFWSFYLGASNSPTEDKGCPRGSYTACPMHAPKRVLQRFPPTNIVLAKHDVLLDEGLEFARLLNANSEGKVDLVVYNNTVHGFFGRFGPGNAAVDAAAQTLVKYANRDRKQRK